MSFEDRDTASIYDMLDAAQSLQRMMGDVDVNGLVTDRKLLRAVEREIEIIGEAARRVTEKLKLAHSEVPSTKIITTRHRIAHEYDEIRPAILHRIATHHVSELIPQLTDTLRELRP